MHFRFLLYIWVRVDCRPTSKNFAKYLFDDTDGKRYLEDICSMKGWFDKNAIGTFFSARPSWSAHKISYFPNPPSRFLQITLQIFDKIYETKYSRLMVHLKVIRDDFLIRTLSEF